MKFLTGKKFAIVDYSDYKAEQKNRKQYITYTGFTSFIKMRITFSIFLVFFHYKETFGEGKLHWSSMSLIS